LVKVVGAETEVGIGKAAANWIPKVAAQKAVGKGATFLPLVLPV
jgi:hypothetical protein